jgi:hypothetical protein
MEGTLANSDKPDLRLRMVSEQLLRRGQRRVSDFMRTRVHVDRHDLPLLSGGNLGSNLSLVNLIAAASDFCGRRI